MGQLHHQRCRRPQLLLPPLQQMLCGLPRQQQLRGGASQWTVEVLNQALLLLCLLQRLRPSPHLRLPPYQQLRHLALLRQLAPSSSSQWEMSAQIWMLLRLLPHSSSSSSSRQEVLKLIWMLLRPRPHSSTSTSRQDRMTEGTWQLCHLLRFSRGRLLARQVSQGRL